MSNAKRRLVSVSAATLLLTGSSLFATTGIASADTLTTKCGGTVTAHAGDTVKAKSLLGLIDLGTVSGSGTDTLSKTVSGLASSLCKVTVNIVGTASKTVDDTVKTGSKTVNSVTKSATDTVKKATDTAKDAANSLSGSHDSSGGSGSDDSKQSKSGSDKSSSAPKSDSKDAKSTSKDAKTPSLARPIGSANSAPFGSSVPGFSSVPFGSLPTSSSFKSAPYKELSFAPTPSAALRYGGHFKQYQPKFGSLAPENSGVPSLPTPTSNDTVNNAGQAETLPFSDSGIGLPVLLAVIALAGVSAGLVRTWVLQKAAALG